MRQQTQTGALQPAVIPRHLQLQLRRVHGVRVGWCTLVALTMSLLVCTSLSDMRAPHALPAPAPSGTLSDLPLPAQAAVSKVLGRDNAAYHAGTRAGTLAISNPRHQLSAQFTAAGLRIQASGTQLKTALTAIGFAGALHPVMLATPRAHANRIEYQRGPLTEWYINGPAGLEQGFTLTQPPAGHPTSPLTLALTTTGAAAQLHRDKHGITYTTPNAQPALTYHGLTTTDARGHHLPATLQTHANHTLIHINTTHAHYPITIDPIYQAAKLSPSTGSDVYGGPVAVDGDTIVAAGDRGPLYVFVKPSGGWVDATETATLATSNNSPINSIAAANGTIVAAETHGLSGAVAVFLKPSGGWVDATPVAKLSPSDGANEDDFGRSIATDGDIIVAGSPSPFATDAQRAYLYTRPPGGWVDSTETTRLTASDNHPGDHLGASVAILGDTVVLGAPAPGYGINPGAAYVYVRPSTGWPASTQNEAAKLTASDGVPYDAVGSTVAVTSSAVVASAPTSYSGHPGALYVFPKPAGGWVSATQSAKLTTTLSATGLRLLTTSDDRLTAHDADSMYTFTRPAGGWVDATEGSKLPSPAGLAAGGGDVLLAAGSGLMVNVFVDDATAPLVPEISGTQPGSPANENAPRLVGFVEAHATVRVYRTSDCSGPAVAVGTADTFSSTGVPVAVADDVASTLRVSATDRAGNVSGCSPPVTYVEDSTAPDSAILTGPAGAGEDPTPRFTFSSNDPGARFECSVDTLEFAPCASPITTAPLVEGAHTFRVRAVDRAGNADPSPASRAFAVDTSAPLARIVATPNPVLTGVSVRFDASASSDPPAGTIARYEWDLDGNGSYETDTGTTSTATRAYKTSGELLPRVRVTNTFGRSATAGTTLSLRTRPPRGPVGVRITRPGTSTRQRLVRLTITWPRLARTMTIADNRRFANAKTTTVKPATTWRVPATRATRRQRTVYVRFDDNPRTYTDTITLSGPRRKRR